MPRFHVPPEQVRGKGFLLLGSEARHAARVLRKKVGDVLDLFDGKNLSFQGRIDAITSERIEGTILSQDQAVKPALPRLTLCQALIKGPKWDWLVEKACEIGVATLAPLTTVRTVVKPSHKPALERWKRIALAASKQCGRADVMGISEPKTFPDAIENLTQGGLALIPWEKEQDRTIRAATASSPAAAGRGPMSVFIGPEGGWESSEIDLAVRHGVIPVTLGPTLLRSETAGLIASALVLAECAGDFG